MSNLSEHLQKFSLGTSVTLVEVDLTQFGEGILRWVVGDEGDTVNAVVFDGQTYSPFPVKLEGFEQSASGPLPRPTIVVSDVAGILTPIVMEHGGLRGGIVRRIQTYDRFLDDGADPDPDAVHPPDVYILGRKVRHKPGEAIQWELIAAMDVEGVDLPARQVVRDFCDQSYRVWDPVAGAFDYTNVTCDYTGTSYYDANDTACPASGDVCGKRLGSCKLRFGANEPLSFRGFPAVTRVRVR